MILSINNLCKSFGEKEILHNVNFTIEKKDKVALVGINGAGKSTLFKIITNQISYDDGEYFVARDANIGYLSQNFNANENYTIYEYVLLAFKNIISMEEQLISYESDMNTLKGLELENTILKYTALNNEFEKQEGYSYKSKIMGVLKGLGFNADDFNKKISSLSGGQKTRLSLAKTLLQQPDILLLDEPTNHIDVKSIEWLESYLKNYNGAVIIISHDRYFLDNFVSKVIELENKITKIYYGNFTDYLTKREIDKQLELQEYINNQKEIKRQEKVIQTFLRFNRERSVRQARSRQKQLDKMTVLPKPISIDTNMKLSLTPSIQSGFDVLTINDLSMSFDTKTLFDSISFEIKRSEKVALIGDNGVGKTTLFKILLNQLKQQTGEIKLGSNVNIAYYEQSQEILNDDLTVYDSLNYVNNNITNFEVRSHLAKFMFYDDDLNKKVGTLSGGEKGRLALAKIMYSKANFLLLDEPTNHLDIYSKEILEEAIQNYEGTVFVISHDRYFINNICNKIIELKDKKLKEFVGDYDNYIEKRSNTEVKISENFKVSTSKQERLEQKEAEKLKRKRKREIDNLEESISNIENTINNLDVQLHDSTINNDLSKLNEIYSKKEALESELNILIEKWELLL